MSPGSWPAVMDLGPMSAHLVRLWPRVGWDFGTHARLTGIAGSPKLHRVRQIVGQPDRRPARAATREGHRVVPSPGGAGSSLWPSPLERSCSCWVWLGGADGGSVTPAVWLAFLGRSVVGCVPRVPCVGDHRSGDRAGQRTQPDLGYDPGIRGAPGVVARSDRDAVPATPAEAAARCSGHGGGMMVVCLRSTMTSSRSPPAVGRLRPPRGRRGHSPLPRR
jgi:hypothetical protein